MLPSEQNEMSYIELQPELKNTSIDKAHDAVNQAFEIPNQSPRTDIGTDIYSRAAVAGELQPHTSEMDSPMNPMVRAGANIAAMREYMKQNPDAINAAPAVAGSVSRRDFDLAA